MSEAYAEHLASLHGRFAAPSEMIASAARELTPSRIRQAERIVHGEANEVYRIGFESELQVILRIGRRGEALFQKEAWVIRRCRDLGMAVPDVLSIQQREAAGESLEFCFMEMLPGQRLSDCLSLPLETLRSVAREVGEQLSRMHSVRLEDLGDGWRFFEHDTDDFLATEEEFVRLGVGAALDQRALRRAFRFFEAAMDGTPPARRLTHNDIRACHVMVHDGRLSGLIDFGQASIDTPINEFAKWDYWEAPTLPAAWLREGYADQSLFDAGYDRRFAALRIANALWVLRWYSITNYPEGVHRAATAIGRYLAELGLD